MQGARTRDVWLTGFAAVSSAAPTIQGTWSELSNGSRSECNQPSRYSPYWVFPVSAAFDGGLAIPKRSDRRQMGPMMEYAVTAATDALKVAGLDDPHGPAATMGILVAAGAGERDADATMDIFRTVRSADRPMEALNAVMAKSLRPSSLLAQLPNLVAGNIAIVRQMRGPRRTYLGEELAGVEAIRTAMQQIRSGQSEVLLVGGTKSTCCEQSVLALAARGVLHSGQSPTSVWNASGMCLGGGAAFLVLESPEHADRRGAACHAVIRSITASAATTAEARLKQARKQWHNGADAGRPDLVISGASGAPEATTLEREWLQAELANAVDVGVVAPANFLGHAVEASFPMNLAIAAMCLRDGRVPPACHPEPGPFARRLSSSVRTVAVTSWGHRCGEALAVIEGQ